LGLSLRWHGDGEGEGFSRRGFVDGRGGEESSGEEAAEREK
jgi:hypothetical protein